MDGSNPHGIKLRCRRSGSANVARRTKAAPACRAALGGDAPDLANSPGPDGYRA